ncbi:MAG: organomercurial lyase [Acidobacteriota bacterium]
MDFDTRVRRTIYEHFATTGRRPELATMAERVEATTDEVIASYRRLSDRRVLVLDDDGISIAMALPFSGVPTQHTVESDGVVYTANCAWDALGVPAALQRPATVHSRCEQSREPFRLDIGVDGPESSEWLFHSLVPASKWWADIVFT